MNDTKHTPGPWKTRPTYNNGHTGEGYRFVIETASTSGGCTVLIAETCVRLEKLPDGPHATWDHQAVNANLIAAAPDLLEALERLHDGVANWITRGVTDEDMRLANRAIAKAKGETCEQTG